MNLSDLRLAAPGGAWVAAVLAVAFAVLLAREWRTLREVERRDRRVVLALLRVATACALLALALQPQWVERRVRSVDGRVAVLLDLSRSMSVRGRSGSRAQEATDLVARWRREDGVEPVWYGFGREVRVLDPGEPRNAAAFHEDDTRVRGALETVVREQGDALGAVVLVSDGADTSPRWSIRDVAPGVRVHAVAVGAVTAGADDAITAVKADALAFLREPTEIEVSLKSSRLANEPVVVTLRREGRVVVEREAKLGMDGTARVVLPFTPDALGRAVYTASIPLASDDAVPENNERVFLVRVERDKLRVLLVCGGPSWDTRFLRAFLKQDPTIDLITFFILRTPNDLANASPDELSLIPFPTRELFEEHLPSFDVVIFQDFNFGPYEMAQYLPRIRDHVRAGGAFAMIGGARSFAAGEYTHTPVAEILPVALDTGVASGAFRPAPASGMERHPLVELALEPVENARRWAELAPLDGANRVARVLHGAQALLVHPVERDLDGKSMSVLTVGESGAGRTLALAVDGSWRWGFTSAGARGDPSAYERFWDRALRWLARDPLLDPSRVRTDRERYAPGAPIEVRAVLRDAAFAPLAATKLELRLRDLGGKVLRTAPVTTDASGAIVAELEAPPDPRGYAVGVGREGQPAPLAEENFVVDAGGDELSDPRSRPDWLRSLATASGGRFVAAASSAPGLAEFDRSRAQALGTVVRAPFASAWYFAFLVVLLAAEWALRRAWGLR
jgi:uncharacterized membrane protein